MADISTANLDAGSDSPGAARPNLLEAVQLLNALTHTATGEGVSRLGIEDPFFDFDSTNAEGALQEAGLQLRRAESMTFGSRWRQRTTTFPKVVITGDSLSFNREDFDATGRANAYDCFPGLNSWAFLLRDALIRDDPWFQHADEVLYQLSDTASEMGIGSTTQFVVPFNGRMTQFRATAQAATVDLFVRHMGPQAKGYLWFLRNPLNTGCSFDVLNGVGTTLVSDYNAGGTVAGTDPYQGLELVALEVDCNNNGRLQQIRLTDFIGTHLSPHATNRDVFFMGFGSRYTQVNLTGRGGQSSKWLADNLAGKLTSYAPDLAVVIIGANDPWSGNPQGLQTTAQYETNLNTIIDGVFAANAQAEMLLISPPYTSESHVSNAVMQTYINTARKVARTRGIGFLGLDRFFGKTPTTVYRFDQIHFSKQGNEQLARKVFKMVLGTQEVDRGYLSPHFSFYGTNVKISRPKIDPARFYYAWSGTEFAETRLSGDPDIEGLVSIAKSADGNIVVTLPFASELFGAIRLFQLGSTGSWLPVHCSGWAYFHSRVSFALRKSDGSLTTAADWTSNPGSFQFILELS
jgi:hypothetical protein